MADRRRRPPPPRTVLIPPDERCWIESDAYDRSAFAALLTDSRSLAELAERGAALVPHVEALLHDLVCLLFKLEPRRRPAGTVAAAAALNGVVLSEFEGHALLEELRERTQLDEMQAALGTVLLGEHVLALVRSERLLPRSDLLELWDLERTEEALRARAAELRELDRLAGEDDADAAAAARRARDEAVHAARVAEAKLRQKSGLVRERLREIPAAGRAALSGAVTGLDRRIADAADEAERWGTGLGAAGRTSPARKIELGRRLATNPKLRRLAALVGRMREQALALRRRPFERASEEVFDVRLGADLERLLPPELVALHHPLLRRDFARRLIEGRVLSYALRGADERGRGPMIVCLDGSGSMAGDQEIWSQAVALTLLEIARRQRRLFRFICFSSADTPLFTLDLNPRERHEVHADRALDLAEYFPGGGTDFQTPLAAAVDCLRVARYRRGDVVLITDGECQVAPDWLARFRVDKQRLGFALWSVLIDVGPSTASTLAELSDRVTAVSTLADDGVRDLFLRL